MRIASTISIFVFVAIFLLLPSGYVLASNMYWFQVGVLADIGTLDVTGASVQIKTHVPIPTPQTDTSFWVGLNLPNNAFIQVGYDACVCTGGYPVTFWEYYPPNTASQGGGRFLGNTGDEVGPNATWYTYSIESNGNTWSTFVNGAEIGSINLGISNSGGNTPYAVAEV